MSDDENECHPGGLVDDPRCETPDEWVKESTPEFQRRHISQTAEFSDGAYNADESDVNDDDCSFVRSTTLRRKKKTRRSRSHDSSGSSGVPRKRIRRSFDSVIVSGVISSYNTPSSNTRSKDPEGWSQKRLRPQKPPSPKAQTTPTPIAGVLEEKKTRGTPKTQRTPIPSAGVSEEKKGRGRPRKTPLQTPSPPEASPLAAISTARNVPKTARKRAQKEKWPLVFETEVSDSDEDIENETDTPRRRTHFMTIVLPEAHPCARYKPGIEVCGPAHVARVPSTCQEAIAGEKHGSHKIKRSWPGIPKAKFNCNDRKTHGSQADKDWSVQAVYIPVKQSEEKMKEALQVAEDCDEDKAQDTQDSQATDLKLDDTATGFESSADVSALAPPVTQYGPFEEDRMLMLYEGWTAATMEYSLKEALADSCPYIVQIGMWRHEFLQTRREEALQRVRQGLPPNYKEINVFKMRTENTSLFWRFEDLSYFHSCANLKRNMAPVFYMACTGPKMAPPPNYTFTPYNVVEMNVYEEARTLVTSKPFYEIPDVVFKRSERTVCEKPESCVCDSRFAHLYPAVQLVQYNADGTIDLNFDFDQKRAAIECSDVCKCSRNCPRRRLQQKQTVPLCVYYENADKGYGVRTMVDIKKGQLIAEYNGDVFFIPKDPAEEEASRKEERKKKGKKDESSGRRRVTKHEEPSSEAKKKDPPKVVKDQSYEACPRGLDDRLAVCAFNKGNVSRFINHSCEPNTVFVDVYSRRYESDVMLPRIGVYALKDIPMGVELTIAYWSRAELENVPANKFVPCRCEAASCMKRLPC